MIEDVLWQQELMVALHLENLFDSAQLGFVSLDEAGFIKPTQAESARAVANIRAWRAYLPEACMAKMIDDGWQWST